MRKTVVVDFTPVVLATERVGMSCRNRFMAAESRIMARVRCHSAYGQCRSDVRRAFI
jgi:hypothetical protein